MGGAIREETCQIEPTVIENISWDNAIMQEEIFGPLLPILTFTDLDEVVQTLLDKENLWHCICSASRSRISIK